MNEVCAREGCNNPLNTGRTYCSTACANRANADKRRPVTSANDVAGIARVIRGGAVPQQIENMLVEAVGHTGANVILQELESQIGMHESGVDGDYGVTLGLWPEWARKRWPIGTSSTWGVSVPLPSLKPPTAASAVLEPDAVLVQKYDQSGFVSDIRREEAISFADIDRLMKLGPYVMGSRLKKGPIMSALSGKRKWSVECDNNKLKAIVEADLERVLQRNVFNILTALDYGVAFGSVRWEKRTADRVGAAPGVGRGTEWWVVDKIEWAHPSTVQEIIRDRDTNSFAGYYHYRRYMNPNVVVIDPMQALVITYGGLFGNMWGQPMGEVIYDFAFWYEVIVRAFLRYLQRMGTPVAVVYGPNRGTSKRPDGTRISNPEYGLLLAGAAAMSAGIYLPSEVDLQTGQPLWRMEYLDTDQKGEQFIAALRYFGTQITRGMLVGDRSATQDDETGSYNIGRVHAATTQIDNDFIFKEVLGQLNDYLVVRYGMWNVDYNNPPMARLKAEVIDPMEQEVLMKLFATAGNVKIHDGTPLDRVDWEEAFRSIHVPLLTEEEFEASRKKTLEYKEENMAMAQRQGPIPQPFGGQQQKQGQGQPQASKNGGQQVRAAVLEFLADGGAMPVILTPEQVQLLKEPRMAPLELAQVTKSGDPVKNPEFEEKHNRGPAGRFAKKQGDTDEDEEEGEDDRDALDQETWPGATTWEAPNGEQVAIKGVVTLDGVEYTVVDGVSKEQLLAIHETNMRMYERGAEFYGEELSRPAVFVVPGSEGVAMMDKHPISGAPSVILDTGFDTGGDLEHALFHETLHAQPRSLRPGSSWDGVPLYPEEAFTGILSLEYAERYNLPLRIGWTAAVSPIAAAAQARGWSKQRLYDFAERVHKVDGPLYKSAVRSLLRGTNIGLESYYDALDEWWDEWAGWNGAERTRLSWPEATYGDW